MWQPFAMKINVIAKRVFEVQERLKAPLKKLEEWEGLGNDGGKRKYV